MTGITHHIAEGTLRAYAAGQLPYAFAVVVAVHVSLCDDCRAAVEADELLAGALLDRTGPVKISLDARLKVMAALDADAVTAPPIRASGIYPAPVVESMNGRPPKWRMLGGGMRQQILSADDTGSLRLLFIPPGRAVPDHGHGGLELTLVLQGSFQDSLGQFRRGDVETADNDTAHQPVASPGEPCICLAATDAPLRFRSLVPRLLQPMFRI